MGHHLVSTSQCKDHTPFHQQSGTEFVWLGARSLPRCSRWKSWSTWKTSSAWRTAPRSVARWPWWADGVSVWPCLAPSHQASSQDWAWDDLRTESSTSPNMNRYKCSPAKWTLIYPVTMIRIMANLLFLPRKKKTHEICRSKTKNTTFRSFLNFPRHLQELLDSPVFAAEDSGLPPL